MPSRPAHVVVLVGCSLHRLPRAAVPAAITLAVPLTPRCRPAVAFTVPVTSCSWLAVARPGLVTPSRTSAAPSSPPVFPACIPLRPPSWARRAAILPGTRLVLPGTPRPSRAPIGRPAATRGRSRIPLPAETRRPISRCPGIRGPPWPVWPLPGPAAPAPVRGTRTSPSGPRRPFSAIGSPPGPIRSLPGRPAVRTAPGLVRPPTSRPTLFPAGLTLPGPSAARSGTRRTCPPATGTSSTTATPPIRRPGSPPGRASTLAARVPAGTTSRRILLTPTGRLTRHVFLRHYRPALLRTPHSVGRWAAWARSSVRAQVARRTALIPDPSKARAHSSEGRLRNGSDPHSRCPAASYSPTRSPAQYHRR